ncbi:DMT family transporter [Corynebacterium suicordis]|uniref:DMT family transporter n=1 Tax=Corynebacterium suicordis DSM 45110 TaxID=1121369 RepID=A0ABR9ZGX4_9CORY|nr:DMT family transporter [Corynebacterium suicordis]MBF4552509.1 DMT family transporter [Corynebacterium suicordis DSM 45110]MDR6278532.1 transporter family-2 protein [Corynebacterium suicordis]
MLLVACGILVGCLLPIQTAANTRLKMSVGTPISATFYSFLIGFSLLVITSLVTTGAILPGIIDFGASASPDYAGAPWWIWLGGVAGVGMLLGNILLFPRLGALQTVVLPIAGQIISGLLIDQFGLFHAPHTPLTIPPVLGALLVILGVLITVGVVRPPRSGRFFSSHSTPLPTEPVSAPGPQIWLWRLLGVFIGGFTAVQASINSQLGVLLSSPVRAATVSFAVGVTVLALLVIFGRQPLKVTQPKPGSELASKGKKNPPWMWIGGFIGAGFVTTQAILVGEIGTGMTVISALMGMMVGSLLVDRFGLMGAPRVPVTKAKLAGLLVMLVGVAMVRLVG